MKRTAMNSLLPAIMIVMALGSAAWAAGPEVGVGAYPFAGFSVGAHAILPLFEHAEVQHAARADVAYAFGGLPGLSVTYLLRETSDDTGLIGYVGAGLGVSFTPSPSGGALLGAHGLAGLRFPLVGGLGTFTELVLAGNSMGTRLSLGAGLSFAFGVDR